MFGVRPSVLCPGYPSPVAVCPGYPSPVAVCPGRCMLSIGLLRFGSELLSASSLPLLSLKATGSSLGLGLFLPPLHQFGGGVAFCCRPTQKIVLYYEPKPLRKMCPLL